ncbi:MAG: isopeptide-forming domain-containing fimbrial protein [Clostridium sp.]|uniref:isopeptide-forming domain-containing fimbrial protein n=1 Tax=Clostridium sp. TaxID=1506 RepID=UPI003F2F877D
MSILTCAIDKTSNVSLLLGGTTTFTLKIKNISSNIRLYNLNIYLILPDGMSLYSSTIQETSSTILADGSIKLSWINLKDLAPLEVEYDFDITVKSKTTFKDGTTIPFGYIFNGITVRCEMDTMPRGIYDIGNQKESVDNQMTFKVVRFYNTISTPGKILKGAGTSIINNDYVKIYAGTCKFYNNAVQPSNMNITILLDNGIRYLGGITTSGTDSQLFLYPVISNVNIDGKVYLKLYYGNITLSKNSNTTLNFKYGVWNRYYENTGNIIEHGTKLNISTNMTSVDDSVDNSISFSAMDLIITTSVDKQYVDINESIMLSYTYEVGGYYDLQDINVDYILPDGVSYISSSSEPYYAEENPVLMAYELKYYFATAYKTTMNTININCIIDSDYRYKFDQYNMKLPVVAFDSFISTCSIIGTKTENLVSVTDNSGASCSIKVPTILKEFLNGYYRNGVKKTIAYLAPGDLAEYTLTYDSTKLKAIQNEIYLDDFFPLAADPIDNINYTITGYNPISSPQLISPHGVDFYYGDIEGNSLSKINFKVPIKYSGTTGENINLLKLKGINTAGMSYSNRMQVSVNIGSPNLQLTKTVTGPNKNAIKSGEVYNYTVKISNTNNLGTETDAFDFTIADQFSTWFNLNVSSITVSGTGSFGTSTYDTNGIQVSISKLAPGTFVTLSYSVTIISQLAPGVSITTVASSTNPYSQSYDEYLDNYQYAGLNKTASTTIASQNVSVNKSSNVDAFKVGSDISYTITVTVPVGTVVYDLYIKDTLSNGNQVYNGEAFKNGVPIAPVVNNNVITIPNEGYIDARNAAKTIIYLIKCKITKGTKTKSATISTQNNSVQVLFKQKSDSLTWNTVSKTLSVTINHPNILMNLTANDISGTNGYIINNKVIIGAALDFKLSFNNNSTINLVNGKIEIPISSNFIFQSIGLTNGCTAIYDSINKKVIISIGTLQPGVYGTVIFTVVCLSNINAGTIINTQGTAVQYYNDIQGTAVYSGEQSNICVTSLAVGLSLLPDPLDKIDDSTSYRVTTPGGTVTILNYFTNTGGGYDNFDISIDPVDNPYTLYIDNVKISDVIKNTLYTGAPNSLKNMAPQDSRIIKVVSVIPLTSPLGCRYNFIVTTKSETDNTVKKTILNIDPT